MTQKEWDNGKEADLNQEGSATLTGKLYWRVMALIRWQVGANRAVMEHVVQVLEEWLCRQGITIYTDQVLP
jgi:hypothetical protein